MGSLLAADRKPVQQSNVLQILYNQETSFLESDFEMLYMQLTQPGKATKPFDPVHQF
jgi:hypothetical protein